MQQHRGLATIHHSGAVVGGSSQMLKVLDPELDIVLITNGYSSLEVHALVDAVIDTCVPGLPSERAESRHAPLTGDFYSAASGRVISLVERDGKQALTVSGFTLPAWHDTGGAVRAELLLSDLRIQPVFDAGAVVGLEVEEFGTAERLSRVHRSLDAAAPVGRYEHRATRMSAVIEAAPEGSRLRLANTLGFVSYSLEALGPCLWRASAIGGLAMSVILEVQETGFLLTSGRNGRLRFTRL